VIEWVFDEVNDIIFIGRIALPRWTWVEQVPGPNTARERINDREKRFIEVNDLWVWALNRPAGEVNWYANLATLKLSVVEES
jgi:hypothetical protein